MASLLTTWTSRSTLPPMITGGSETIDLAALGNKTKRGLRAGGRDSPALAVTLLRHPRRERSCLVRKEEKKRDRKLFRQREMVPLRSISPEKKA